MGTAEEELITEGEAARCLSVTLYQLRELSAQGRLQSITVQVPGGQVVLYYRGEVLRLSESLKGMPSATEDWPDVIDE